MNYTRILVRSIVLLGALIVTFASSAGVSAAGPAEAPIPCIVGYLCVQQSDGAVIYVPEGERRQFSGGLWIASITNATQVTYCVTANPSFNVPPGRAVVRSQIINGVVPLPPGGVCVT